MRSVLSMIFKILIALIFLGFTAWGAAALWFRVPAPDLVRWILCGVFALLGLSATLSLVPPSQPGPRRTFALAGVALIVWWISIDPPANGDWAPEVAQQVTGQIEGDQLTLTNMRDFTWQTPTDFSGGWTQGEYDLSQIATLDLFMSYWGRPEMAHLVLSFGFTDGRYLAWSSEVRREAGGGFSPIADFFKEHTIVSVASDEQDLIGLRTNARGEDVYLFRLNTPPDRARSLLEEYVRESNALAERPKFFNSILTNCTTTVVRMAEAIGDDIPFDWRMVVNGYLPEYLAENGALAEGVSIAELREQGRIGDSARAAGLGPAYSEAIRVDVPAGR